MARETSDEPQSLNSPTTFLTSILPNALIILIPTYNALIIPLTTMSYGICIEYLFRTSYPTHVAHFSVTTGPSLFQLPIIYPTPLLFHNIC